ncbi:NlpC/P60 family protein [Paenibacillus zeisoli]|uniref:NlpC/P60 family protein n=2 Tax=Paenibacillus zeisoli TaxID=2496267 RepID=A0A3S1BRI6_9BACL|nr:NlpC/P60 family protein [Paenibacillus zeisoli]
MNNTNIRRIGKTIVGISLSLLVSLSGSVLLNAQSAHAATSATVTSSTKANRITASGERFLGTPYKFGAKTGVTSSFDCSSFTQYLYKQVGVRIPRSSKDQSRAGKYVSKSKLKSGDLVFSDTNRDGVINHVSIYIGNGKLLHTYRVGIGVTISTFKGSTWDKTYVTARRVL